VSASRQQTESFRAISTKLFLKHRPRRDRVVKQGRYTPIEAFLSMHMDVNAHGRLLSERDYSRLWRRGRKWVKARIDEFKSDSFCREYADQLGVHLGSQTGYQNGYQQGNHPSITETKGLLVLGHQAGNQKSDQLGVQRGDQQGATTKRREETEKRERGNGADAPLSALSDLVLEEQPTWTEVQSYNWLQSNLPRIKDAVDAKRPSNRDAAVRSTVRAWAHRERETPSLERPSVPPAPHELETHPKRALARRRIAQNRGVSDPSEELIRREFEQFAELMGEYVPPD